MYTHCSVVRGWSYVCHGMGVRSYGVGNSSAVLVQWGALILTGMWEVLMGAVLYIRVFSSGGKGGNLPPFPPFRLVVIIV